MFSTDSNLNVLRSISGQYPLRIFSTLRYPGVLAELFNYINYFIPIFAIFGYTVVKGKFQKLAIILLALASFVILNGTNFPTGYLMQFIFQKFSIMQLLRNPYEKYGIVLVLVYSLLFSTALIQIFRKCRLLFSIIILISGVSCIFLWRGLVFGDIYNNAYITIPKSYTNIINYLNNDKEIYRILSIPFIPGDGVRFNWKSTYTGIQPFQYIFQQPSVDKISGIPDIDQYWKVLRQSYYQGKLNEFVGYGNIKYVIVSKDINTKHSNLDSPLKELSFIDEGIAPDYKKLTAVCEGYAVGTLCNVDNIDFQNVNFITLDLKSESGGKVRLDLLDINNERLVFGGENDNYYVLDSGVDSFTFDIRNPTERYKNFIDNNIKYLSISVYNGDVQVSKIYLNKGIEKSVQYYEKVVETDNVDLYKFDDTYFIPRIYTPSKISEVISWNKLLSMDAPPDAFVFGQDKVNNLNYTQTVEHPPKINITKISPDKYIVKVIDVNSPYWLIFSESYNPKWSVLDTDGNRYHSFKINGFSNGYYISNVNSDTLTLEFNI